MSPRARGAPPRCVCRLVASLAGLALVWDRALARALVHPVSHILGERGGQRARWFGRVPPGPWGAILARSLTYWRRDPRYAMAVAAVPLMSLATWAFGLGDAVLLVLPFLGVIMGWSIASDTSSDGTAFWLHVAAPVRGLDDRVGRAVAAGVILGPLVVLLSTFLALVMGRAALLPGTAGATLGAFLTALGAAQRDVRPGRDARAAGGGEPLRRPAGWLARGGAVPDGRAGRGRSAGLAGGRARGPSYAWSSSVLGWVGLLVGLVLGALLAVVGVRWVGHSLDRRAPVPLQRLVAVSWPPPAAQRAAAVARTYCDPRRVPITVPGS